VLFYATFPLTILIGLEKFLFVRSMGYAEYYVSYKSHFPYVVVKIADACIIAYYIFLATFPSKKEIKIPTILYIINAVVSLGSGKRQEFIVPLFLLILYFCIRNKINRGDSPWITSRSFKIILIIIPFLLIAMFTYNTSRFSTSKNGTENDIGFVEQIAGFFENTGFSVNVISFEKYYEDQIPDKCYSFGDTIDYIRENVVTQLFFDFPVYKTQTAEKALYGNNFSQTLTYIRSASYYLSGRGYGSCYIAEAYHDFGYAGVVFWSMLYSFALAFMYDYRNKGIIYVTISLSALHYILIAPRNMASSFISEMINMNTWLVLIFILLFSNIVRKKLYIQR
jgi:oligosaccharide repeat unit polymerase